MNYNLCGSKIIDALLFVNLQTYNPLGSDVNGEIQIKTKNKQTNIQTKGLFGLERAHLHACPLLFCKTYAVCSQVVKSHSALNLPRRIVLNIHFEALLKKQNLHSR